MDAADALPSATRLDRITWTTSAGLTRLELHGHSIPPAVVAQPSSRVLRLDFTAADAAALPSRLEVKSPEVASVVVVPSSVAGLLPEGVSARLLVTLAADGFAWSLEPSDDRLTLFVGESDKAGRRALIIDTGFYHSEAAARAAGSRARAEPDEAPQAAELFARSVAFAVEAEQSVRAAPSDLAADRGSVRAGETKLADARRGDWVHLVGGGWVRRPESEAAGAAAAASARAARTPAEWSVVTLGTGLQANVAEVLPDDPAGLALARAFRVSVRLARLSIRVQGGSFAFQLPPKKGRLAATLPGGRVIESLDPRELPLSGTTPRETLLASFEAPEVFAGEAWQTMLVLPGDTDFLAITEISIDIGGQRHKLFRIPGSGEAGGGPPEP